MVLNARLGHYTNFVNLLDLAALSAAATMPADALPVDITLIHRAGSDLSLAEFGERAPRTCRSERGSHSYRA